MNKTYQKTLLITGGSSGIGLSLADMMASTESWEVISVSRNKEKIERALKTHPHLENKVSFLLADVSNPEDIERIVRLFEEDKRPLHALVNNAGVLVWGGIHHTTADQWRQVMKVNLEGPFLITKALLPALERAEGASVVNISSIAALQPGTSISYSAAKAGLDMVTQYLAGELGPMKIRVNSVNPGLIATNLHMDNQVVNSREEYQSMLEKSAAKYPLGRIGKPEDIASLIKFLISEESGWITGSIIKADGGTTLFNELLKKQ